MIFSVQTRPNSGTGAALQQRPKPLGQSKRWKACKQSRASINQALFGPNVKNDLALCPSFVLVSLLLGQALWAPPGFPGRRCKARIVA